MENMTLHVNETIHEWRADGWPLCPRCGEDELYSLLHWDGKGQKPPMSEWLNAGLRCYYCHWSDLDELMKTKVDGNTLFNSSTVDE
jgi:hypothetical protein